jgi:hypothetical protein
MNDKIINILCIIALIYILYQSYIEYQKDLEFKDNFITDHKELENKLQQCNNSKLYNIYKNLSKEDKKFLDIYINYARLKQKNNKPKYNKLYNGIKNQIIFSTILTFLLKRNSTNLLSTLRQNTLQQFGTHFL